MPTLRHIRPHSMEWDEATIEDDGPPPDRLEPEQATRLRNMLEAEQATLGMPPLGPKRAVARSAPR